MQMKEYREGLDLRFEKLNMLHEMAIERSEKKIRSLTK